MAKSLSKRSRTTPETACTPRPITRYTRPMGKQKGKREQALALIEEVGEELSERQKLFAILYTTDKSCFGNAAASYAEAYGLTPAQRKNMARNCGYRLLTNAHIKTFIDGFLKLGFTDDAVDNELAKIIYQNKQLQPKIQAISEYNKLRSRIKDELPQVTQNFFFLNEEQRKRIAGRVIARNQPIERIPG